MSEVYTTAKSAKEDFQKRKSSLIMSNPSLIRLLDLLLGMPLYFGSYLEERDGKYYAATATRKRVAEKIASGEIYELLRKLEEESK